MRKIMLMGSISIAGLLVSACALAVEFGGGTGVYIAPKLGLVINRGNFYHEDTQPGDEVYDSLGIKNKGFFTGGAALGYDFSVRSKMPLRAELEYMHLGRMRPEANKSEPDGTGYGNVKATLTPQTLFGNFYYDFHNPSRFTPYFGAGLGIGFLTMKGNSRTEIFPPDPEAGTYYSDFASKRQTNFAWNIGVGSSVALSKKIALDIGYRFSGLGKARTGGRTDADGYHPNSHLGLKSVYSHQILAGLRVNF